MSQSRYFVDNDPSHRSIFVWRRRSGVQQSAQPSAGSVGHGRNNKSKNSGLTRAQKHPLRQSRSRPSERPARYGRRRSNSDCRLDIPRVGVNPQQGSEKLPTIRSAVFRFLSGLCVMNERRFTGRCLPCFPAKDSTPRHGRLLHPSSWERMIASTPPKIFRGSQKQATPLTAPATSFTTKNRFTPNFRG